MVDQTSLLLELAASDDLPSFRQAVEKHGYPINTPSPWYGRWSSPSKPTSMSYELRTPLMVAALYGSTNVLTYILSTPSVDVNTRSPSDSAAALHCAAASGSPSSLSIINFLFAAGADLPTDLTLPAPRKVNGSITPTTKKEYPVDSTLPDMKSGVYGTDEFRMYSFKVRPCSRAYAHEWTECPFAHPGENARRRDPRKYHYLCVPCPDFKKGACRKGDACGYAHGVFESWLHPSQYRTRLCKDEVGCNRRVCFFAHRPGELRHPSGHSSPRSPPLDHGKAEAMMLLNNQQRPASPRVGGWLDHGSLLKSKLELDLLALQQQQLLMMKARAAAFAKRSQSFVARGLGSPEGRLDWAVGGEELSKMRRSVSFGLNGDVIDDGPDVSWVQSLVSDGKGGGVDHGLFWSNGDRVYRGMETVFA